MAIIRGTEDGETIDGTDEADFILGLGGDDTISGGRGDDVIRGGAGADTIIGSGRFGFERDTAEYTDSPSGVAVSLATGVGFGGDAEGDRLISIENLTGSQFNDTLIGNTGANILNGLNGNDRLMGGEGPDRLIGGSGRDTADYSDSLTRVQVSLGSGEEPGEGFFGTAQGDLLFGIENLTGSNFNDLLFGNELDNTLVGLAGRDTLNGQDGDDRLFGGANDDWLKGAGGSDRLEGNVGNDVLVGGMGLDTLLGGESADTFQWLSTEETGTTRGTADTVADFNRAEGDLLDFSGIDANVTTDGEQSFTFIGTQNFTAAGQVRWFTQDNQTYIALNTDADNVAEAIIEVSGVHSVNASWFVL